MPRPTLQARKADAGRPGWWLDPAVRGRGPLAITHANVITMESSTPLPQHTVVIEDGVIRALAPSATLDVTGMRVIDGSNRYVMPGLADMHTHITDAGVCRLYLANGITRVRNMDGRPWHLALSHRIARGERTGPRLVSVSPLIDGLGSHGLSARPRSFILTKPEDAEALVRNLVARGYSEIKAYQWLQLDALRALGAAAARAGVRMAGHCPDGITFEQAIEAGMSCFEHLTGIANGRLRDGLQYPSPRDAASRRAHPDTLDLIANHLDFDAIRRLAATMAAKNIWNCPTLVVWQKQIQLPEVALADPDLRYEHPSVAQELERMLRLRFSTLPCSRDEWIALGRGRDSALARVVSILHQEGAPLLLGTDAPNPFVIHGCSIHHELANLVNAGLSPYQALRCGTTEAARFLGESATLGSVAVGKQADLLVLRSNPLQDVMAIRDSLESVVVGGQCLTRADLDRMLKEHAASLSARAGTIPELGEVAEAETVRHGAIEEWFGTIQLGTASYRHCKRADGSWTVEEHLRRSGPRGPQKVRTRLALAADWTVRSAQLEAETDIGRESIEVTWSAGEYRTRSRQADGHETESSLSSQPLLPSERLAFSVLPAWLGSQSGSVEVAALGLEFEAAHCAKVTAAPVLDQPGGELNPPCTNWRVSVARPGEVAAQTYRVGGDGSLQHLQDALFDSRRELRAAAEDPLPR